MISLSLKKNVIESDAELICSQVDLSILDNKTILITGASGLLGIYFLTCIKLLAQNGSNITTIAVFRSELPGYIMEESFAGLKIMKGDITDYEFCQSLPDADFIIHAAGYGQPLRFLESPEKTLRLNTFSTFILFDKLRSDGRFLFVSSSEVYNGLEADIYSESNIGITNTSHPRACYIEGKRGGEAICYAYRSKGINASAVRLAHTYGPGAKKGDKRVILSFIEKALNGQIQLLDDGKAVRTYCYISDAIEVLWKVLLFGSEGIYNLGGTSQTTIAALANQIGRLLNVPVIIPDVKEGLHGAPKDVQLDMTKVKNEFGKETYVTLEEGLKKTINWYSNLDQ